MTGEGQLRSEWNRLLLNDVIGPLYADLMLGISRIVGPGNHFNSFWPIDLDSNVWKTARKSFYRQVSNYAVLKSNIGRWVAPTTAIFVEYVDVPATGKEDRGSSSSQNKYERNIHLAALLVCEQLPVVILPPRIIDTIEGEGIGCKRASPELVRTWLKKEVPHVSLDSAEDALFLLRYCASDIEEKQDYGKLTNLPLLPLCDGTLGKFTQNFFDVERSSFFVCNRAEKELLRVSSQYIVNVWTSDDTVNALLSDPALHAQMDISSLNVEKFVHFFSKQFPTELEGVTEIRWDPDNGVITEQFIADVWKYIASKQLNEIQLFEGKHQLLPCRVGVGEDRTLVQLSDKMAVVSLASTSEELPHNLSSILKTIGLRTVDNDVFPPGDASQILNALKQYVQSATPTGIARALLYSFAEDIEDTELARRCELRFKHVPNDEKVSLRNFFRGNSMNETQWDPDLARVVKSLPIYQSYDMSYRDLTRTSSFLPPPSVDRVLLDGKFIIADRHDALFLKNIGIERMDIGTFYASFVIPNIMEGKLSESLQNETVLRILQEVPQINANKDTWKDTVKDLEFVPNQNGALVSPSDLYDPEIPGLEDICPTDFFPSKNLRHPTLLNSLRILGMQSRFTSHGIIECAKRIEVMDNEDAIKKGTSLLAFLDRDIVQIIKDSTDSTSETDLVHLNSEDCIEIVPSSFTSFESSKQDSPQDLFTSQLLSISWLPIDALEDAALINEQSESFNIPEMKNNNGKRVAPPEMTRPKEDLWLCSASMFISRNSIHNSVLRKIFGWDDHVPCPYIAEQLVNLSQQYYQHPGSSYLREQLTIAVPKMYQTLGSHLDDCESSERVYAILQKARWIFLGDVFVRSDQIAFDAPEARPHMYSVPQELVIFEELLRKSGVKDSFTAVDFAQVMINLKRQLSGRRATEKQLDLACAMAKLLSRLSEEERVNTNVFLPSAEGTFHKADTMTYNDASWLAETLEKNGGKFLHFVHPDIGNETARILGAKSLRQVLSAYESGMKAIPCPKSESLKQLFTERRKIDGKDRHVDDARAVLELIELAEMREGQSVNIMIDNRTHGSESILHPMLNQAQGPGLIICFNNLLLEVDKLVRLSSPLNYYKDNMQNSHGAGGKGYPQFGRGLCAAFNFTDCLQILVGNHFVTFDPTGEYFYDGGIADAQQGNESDNMDADGSVKEDKSPVHYRKNTGKPTARRYGIVGMVQKFPDQFEPFLSLPFVKSTFAFDSPFFPGTVIRLPFRTKPSDISNRIFDDDSIQVMIGILEKKIPNQFLFSSNIMKISMDKWDSNATSSENVTFSQLRSAPSARLELKSNLSSDEWKKTSNLANFFKADWTAKVYNQTLEIFHSHGPASTLNNSGFLDTYVISTILAPTRIRDASSQEVMKSLQLLPSVGLAAHIQRRIDGSIVDFVPSEGTLFCGFDSGIKTGLPFHVNAPIFFHELKGTTLLQHNDDSDFQQLFPWARMIEVREGERRSRSLYTWNRLCLTEAMTDLLPKFIVSIKEAMQLKPKRLYIYWPKMNRVRNWFRNFLSFQTYESLSKLDIFLTEKSGFQNIDSGCFASPEFRIPPGAAKYFQSRYKMFNVPVSVAEDLKQFNINVRELSPKNARKLLQQQKDHRTWLRSKPEEALDLLEYCLSDTKKLDSIGRPQDTKTIFFDLSQLCLMPVIDGSVVIPRVGSKGGLIVANREQQSMFPALADKFISNKAMKRLKFFLTDHTFLSQMNLQVFSPEVIAENMHLSPVPFAWKGKDFVSIDDASFKLWLFQFWHEVSLWDNESVRMFNSWPLIPLKTGELASCASARFVLSFFSDGGDNSLRDTLEKKHAHLKKKIAEKTKRDKILSAATLRASPNIKDSKGDDDVDICFLNSDEEDEDITVLDINESENTTANIANVQTTAPNTEHDDNVRTEVAETQATSSQLGQVRASLNTPSTLKLHKILVKLRSPVLELAYFSKDDVQILMPSDNVQLSRNILNILNQCLDYWTHILLPGEVAPTLRLDWSNLSSDELEFLLQKLTKNDQHARLSLMASDFDLLKALPIFQTLSGSVVSLQDRNEHYTLDPSINADSLQYLPDRMKSKFLKESAENADVLKDIGVESMTEAKLLYMFVLPEFERIPIPQKESICLTILNKFNSLKNSAEFIAVLKETPFVKHLRSERENDFDYVCAKELFDPTVEFLHEIFEDSPSKFPAEQFTNPEWLEILREIGLIKTVDKDTFLLCAIRVEMSGSASKAIKLHRFFSENISHFYDQENLRKLSFIKCVPGEFNDSFSLYKFNELCLPKDRNLVYLISPVMHDEAVPAQVMWSTLGIVSSPTISIVLKHIRALISQLENTDRWTYKFGSIEDVFTSIFSFLQENYSKLSPVVCNGLGNLALVPVGAQCVKPTQLFFRLAKDLSPFFYELPRRFGQFDSLMRNLGVRESPTPEDYAVSLMELKRDQGSSRLGINDLSRCIDLLVMIAEEGTPESCRSLVAPDEYGFLIKIDMLLVNDMPWLVNGGRLNRERMHIVHPKLPGTLCQQLGISRLSNCVREILENNFQPQILNNHDPDAERIGSILQQVEFSSFVLNLCQLHKSKTTIVLRNLAVCVVESLCTRFILSFPGRREQVDITKENMGAICFANSNQILLAKSQLPTGITCELAVSICLSDLLGIGRSHVAAISAMLASNHLHFDNVQKALGLRSKENQDELNRGIPGMHLHSIDRDLIGLKPLRHFSKGEIVGIKNNTDDYVYGVVVDGGGGNELNRIVINLGTEESEYLTSQVYFFKRKSSVGQENRESVEQNQGCSSTERSSMLLRPIGDSAELNLTGNLLGEANISRNLIEPLGNSEILSAVQDILQLANLSLDDNVEEVFSSNLNIREELSKQQARVDTLLDNGNNLASELKKGSETFLCPITKDIMTDPVICEDGHTYEKFAIERWLESKKTSPKTNQQLFSSTLIPNHALRSAIESWNNSIEQVRVFNDTLK